MTIHLTLEAKNQVWLQLAAAVLININTELLDYKNAAHNAHLVIARTHYAKSRGHLNNILRKPIFILNIVES
jgi:hypothetical protein